jgi:hypothetical protein
MIFIRTSILDAIRVNDLVAVQTLISEGCNLKYQIDEEGLEQQKRRVGNAHRPFKGSIPLFIILTHNNIYTS